MTYLLGVTVRMTVEARAWYLDKFGIERECIAVTMTGLGSKGQVIGVFDLDGRQLDVIPESLYYVPKEEEEPTGP